VNEEGQGLDAKVDRGFLEEVVTYGVINTAPETNKYDSSSSFLMTSPVLLITSPLTLQVVALNYP
jgi:hypothetical protein